METILATIASAVISGMFAVIVSSIQHNKTMALITYRIEQLEKKQDKHNNLMERMFKLEQRVDDIEDE